MFTLSDSIKLSIAKWLQETIKKEFQSDIELTNLYDALSPPPNTKMGHLTFASFPVAKLLKKSPVDIVKKLKEALPDHNIVQEANPAGPYLNIKLNLNLCADELFQSIDSGKFFKQKLTENAPKTMVEFSQPNTHKEMHVGHMRNMCLGDALVKIFRYCSVDTVATTFPGDVGTHVAKCLWFLKKHNKTPVPSTKKGAWLGSLYTQGNNLLEEQKGSEQEEKNREELTQILKQLEQKSGEYYELWQETRLWSIDLMNEVYNWANIQFDVVYWESDVDSDSVNYINDLYKSKKLVKDDGAIGMDLSDDKLGFCLLLKSDGTGLYATKDVELAKRKFKDHNIEKNVYVVDNRQAFHFKQVFKVLEKLDFENAKNCFHLQYEMVELTSGAMSSRKGNVVPLQSLIEQMVAKIKTDYLVRYQHEWSEEEIEKVANQVAQGAIKFGMTRIDNNKKIIFDMNEWLKLDGESGPYIQYGCARINSLLSKFALNKDLVNFKSLESESEQNLVLKILDFNNVVSSACKQYKTSLLTSYLYELTKLFSSFYAECPIGKLEDEQLKHTRLALSFMVLKTLNQGLELLGIEAPNKM